MLVAGLIDRVSPLGGARTLSLQYINQIGKISSCLLVQLSSFLPFCLVATVAIARTLRVRLVQLLGALACLGDFAVFQALLLVAGDDLLTGVGHQSYYDGHLLCLWRRRQNRRFEITGGLMSLARINVALLLLIRCQSRISLLRQGQLGKNGFVA